MSRPRTIKMEQGTVYLQDFPKELADSIQEHLGKFGTVSNTSDTSSPAPTGEMPDVAIGVHFDKVLNKAQIVSVSYNVDTGEAMVKEMKAADGMRDATNKFKMLATDLRFV